MSKKNEVIHELEGYMRLDGKARKVCKKTRHGQGTWVCREKVEMDKELVLGFKGN